MIHVADIQAANIVSEPLLLIAPYLRPCGPIVYADPLDPDLPDDPAMILTYRQLIRLLLIAAETGARFQREEIAMDPAAWLFAPRRLFHDRSAVDACAGRSDFIRAILLHGLGLGLDSAPEAMDALVAKDGSIECDGVAVIALPAAQVAGTEPRMA